MNAKTWERVKEAFQKAVDLDSAARAEFLSDLRRQAPEVVREVAVLLDSDDSSDTFLDPPPNDLIGAAAIAAEHADPWIGKTVGRYKLVRRIGSGGMAAVYLATRTEQYEENVAVKLIKLGMDTEAMLRRFRIERQTLANLAHPNIGRLLDGGATEDGRPYLVMEYLDGLPIDGYCDQNSLPIRDRLRLFKEICEAVHFAHDKGVVHRDLKPSNILVATSAGKPLPKIIDFGIASLATGDNENVITLTAAGQVLGSPRYMSPEQADPELGRVDARSDVYSLGVILYLLLVGKLPYERVPQSAEDLRRMTDTDAPTPSGRLAKVDDTETLARQRATDTSRLRKEIRGDLDWITRKAIEKNPERRYANAAQFAEDIGRYLDHEPVIAGPPSAAYRLMKLVRRNKLFFTLVAALFLSVLIGSAVAGLWLIRAEGLHRQRTTMIRVADTVNQRIANAHLWFEEALAGDRSIDIENDVFHRFDGSWALVEDIRSGKETPMGVVNGAVLRESAARLAKLSARLEELSRSTRDRWRLRSEEGKTGGILDQQYDALYVATEGICDELRKSMESADHGDWLRAAGASLVINVVVLVSFVLLALVALRPRRSSSRFG